MATQNNPRVRVSFFKHTCVCRSRRMRPRALFHTSLLVVATKGNSSFISGLLAMAVDSSRSVFKLSHKLVVDIFNSFCRGPGAVTFQANPARPLSCVVSVNCHVLFADN